MQNTDSANMLAKLAMTGKIYFNKQRERTSIRLTVLIDFSRSRLKTKK